MLVGPHAILTLSMLMDPEPDYPSVVTSPAQVMRLFMRFAFGAMKHDVEVDECEIFAIYKILRPVRAIHAP